MTHVRKIEQYSYNFLQEKQKHVTGETGTMSVALAQNIASKKDATFFLNTTDGDVLKLQAIDERRLVNREGKTTFLTKRQQKLTYALSMFLSQAREEDEVKAYVQKLAQGETPNSRITLPINVTILTKLVTTDGCARARQKEEVLSDLQAMADVKQVQTFGEYGTKEGQLRFIAPLIQLSEQMEDLSKDKRLDADFVSVTFGSIFFYELYSKYAIVKPKLFQIWGKSGSGTDTELFGVLLSDLLAKYSGHRIACLQALEKLKKERSKYKTDESYFKARAKVQKEALTYSELASTLQERVTVGYGDSREQKRRFYRDLDKAIQALQEYGLITDSTQVVDTTKGKRVDFVFNLEYDKQDETVVPLLSTPPASTKPEVRVQDGGEAGSLFQEVEGDSPEA
jgi:hypothetical protein